MLIVLAIFNALVVFGLYRNITRYCFPRRARIKKRSRSEANHVNICSVIDSTGLLRRNDVYN
jgi:hypothetical protein